MNKVIENTFKNGTYEELQHFGVEYDHHLCQNLMTSFIAQTPLA